MRIYLALAIVALALNSAAADELSIGDLVGRWCGDGQPADYVFTQTRLTVIFHNGAKNKTLQISKIESSPDQIQIRWKPFKPGNSTSFDLSANKRQLFQLPQTKGDKGPRRVFKRC